MIDGVPTYESSQARVGQTSVAISQQYQFFRNQWFHPHVGAGLEIARKTTTEEFQTLFSYDPRTGLPRQIPPGMTGPVHTVLARPFVEGGFKAYLTRKAFFTGDTRVMVRHGVEEVIFRAGFGIDF